MSRDSVSPARPSATCEPTALRLRAVPRPAEKRVDELLAAAELVRGSLHPELAAAEDVGAIRDLEYRLGPLLDHEHRSPGTRELAHVLVKHLARDDGGEVGGRLVEHDERGFEHQGPAHREHLALASAQLAG